MTDKPRFVLRLSLPYSTSRARLFHAQLKGATHAQTLFILCEERRVH